VEGRRLLSTFCFRREERRESKKEEKFFSVFNCILEISCIFAALKLFQNGKLFLKPNGKSFPKRETLLT